MLMFFKKERPIDSLISLHTFFKHVENSADVTFISCLTIPNTIMVLPVKIVI